MESCRSVVHWNGGSWFCIAACCNKPIGCLLLTCAGEQRRLPGEPIVRHTAATRLVVQHNNVLCRFVVFVAAVAAVWARQERRKRTSQRQWNTCVLKIAVHHRASSAEKNASDINEIQSNVTIFWVDFCKYASGEKHAFWQCIVRNKVNDVNAVIQ
jgi:hypothetical protein